MTELPRGWSLAPLGSLLRSPMINGRSVPSQQGGFPVLRLTALKNDRVDLRERKEGAWTREEATPFLVTDGDFLVSRGSGSLTLVGRGALVDENPDPVAFPDTVIRIRANDDAVLPRFLALQWNSRHVRSQIEKYARTTAGIYKVNQSLLSQAILIVPPLEDQRRIVDILEDHLSRLDSGVGGLSVVLKRSNTLRASMLQSLYVGPVATLGELTLDCGYGTSTKCDYGAQGVAVVRIPNIVNGIIDLTDEKRALDTSVDLSRLMLADGDLLVVRTNGSRNLIGRAAVVQSGVTAAFASYLIRFTVDRSRVRPEWVRLMLEAPISRRIIEGLAASSAGQYNLGLKKLNTVDVPCPSLEEQNRILAQSSNFEWTVESTIQTVARAQFRAAALRRSLLNAAFSGLLTGRASNIDLVEEMAGV